jgi:hypothetical protein
LLLAILACALIILAPLPAFAYEVPPPVHRTVDVIIDINALLYVDYQPVPVQFEVTETEMNAGFMDLEDGGTLKWCTNGAWEMWIWRSAWVTDIGDPLLDLSLGYCYTTPYGWSLQDPYPITTTRKRWICYPSGGCYELTDFIWHLGGLSTTTHKGNYGCDVYFELVDP